MQKVTIIHEMIPQNGAFPGNPYIPLLIYKQVLVDGDPKQVLEAFADNGWKRGWTDSIYDYHHYHSNTHEVLGICEGTCTVQFGGPKGPQHKVGKGDVIIIPAGVAHKNTDSSKSFKTVGAYPLNVQYNMNYGKDEEFEKAIARIKEIPLPKLDPVYGKEGPLFDYWK